MEAFSDGVFSIATTLLVLEIAVHPPGTALEQLRHEWPAYLGYAISFLTIGAAWLAHNAITDRLTRADTLLLRINLLLLFVVAFMPFPTKLIAEALHEPDNERVFVTLYGVTLLTIRLLLFAAGRVRPTRAPLLTRPSRRGLADRTTTTLACPRRVRDRDPRRTRSAETGSGAVLRRRRVPHRAVPRPPTPSVQPLITADLHSGSRNIPGLWGGRRSCLGTRSERVMARAMVGGDNGNV